MSTRSMWAFALLFVVQILAIRRLHRRAGSDCRFRSCTGPMMPPHCQTDLVVCQSSACDGRWCGGGGGGGPADPGLRRRHHGPTDNARALLFGLLNPDHDEIVTREELYEVYKKAGIEDTKIVDDLFDLLDKDDDGLVEFDEFLKNLLQEQSKHGQKRGNQSSATASGSVCRAWDCDGPVLSESCQTDLVACQDSDCAGVWCGGGGDATPDQKVRKLLFGLLDPDHDELVTREELYKVYSNAGVYDLQVVDELFDLLDRDDDGLVEFSEFLKKVLQDVAPAQRTRKASKA